LTPIQPSGKKIRGAEARSSDEWFEKLNNGYKPPVIPSGKPCGVRSLSAAMKFRTINAENLNI